MVTKKNNTQLNNGGFTLLEVLVAMIILAIVSIPLLHAFATSARTNAKSKLQQRATTTAESIMETFKYSTVDELKEFYEVDAGGSNTFTDDAMGDGSGVLQFVIGDHNYFKDSLPAGYFATVTLDPTGYKHSNDVNYADLSTVSSVDSAIYTMPTDLNDQAIALYMQKNDENTGAEKKDKAFFEQNLKRTITVDIDKLGTTKQSSEPDAEDVDIVKINLRILYELDALNVVPNGERKQVLTDKVLFYNSKSKLPLKSIFLLYYPLYDAPLNGGDQIIVNNEENIDANLYVVAQDVYNHGTKWNTYKSSDRLALSIFEDAESTIDDAYKAHLTLRTNLHGDVPYDATEPPTKVMAKLKYYDGVTQKANSTSSPTADHILQAADVDGRCLDASQNKDKIYKMTVKLCEPGATPGDTNEIVAITGSMLE